MTTKPLEKPEVQKKQNLFDPYKVLLHNDDHNELTYVVRSVQKAVPQLPEADVQQIVNEAHQQGVAIVITCPLEHAEMYCDRLKSFGLTASIERDV